MTVQLINAKSGERFEKEFSSPYLGFKFLNKAKRSKKLIVLGWSD